MSIKTPGIAGILTSDFIKLRVVTRYTSPATKQVCSGPVKCTTCTDFLAEEEHLSVTTLLLFVTTFCFPKKF